MSKMSFENHIMTQFDEELEEIRTQLMEMGGKVEQQLKDSIQAVIKADSRLAEEVIREERLVDEMEVDIDEACILIIARRQPAAQLDRVGRARIRDDVAFHAARRGEYELPGRSRLPPAEDGGVAVGDLHRRRVARENRAGV